MERQDDKKAAMWVERIEGPTFFIYPGPMDSRTRKLLLVSALMNTITTSLLLAEVIGAYLR